MDYNDATWDCLVVNIAIGDHLVSKPAGDRTNCKYGRANRGEKQTEW